MAGLAREGNSFGGGLGTVDDFRRDTWCEGEEIFSLLSRNDSMAGALRVADERGVEVVPTFHARSVSGPTMAADAYAELKQRVLDGLAAVVDQVDAVYLRLHGAMTAEGCDDVEGDLLKAVRELVGPDMPIAASFDLHAHLTRDIVATTPLLAGYLTYPHVDMADTGRRAMTLLLDQLAGTINGTVGFRKIPVMSASEVHDTSNGPVAEVARLRDELVASGKILDGSIFTTQPWLDVTGLGWGVVVVTDNDATGAQQCADELAAELFDRRERLVVHKMPLSEAIERAAVRAGKGGPVVLGDGADSPSAGSTGDGADLLAAVLAAELAGPAFCTVVDRPAVATCLAAGLAATVTVRVGGTLSPNFFAPVTVTGRVITISDGTTTSPTRPISSGRGVVLAIGTTYLVITEHPTSMVDPRLYRAMGLDPDGAWLVQAKSAGQYRDGFAHVAGDLVDVDMRGPSQHDLLSLPFRRATHAWWPKDRDVVRGW
ncbi:M81 family metallopeptidase [Microlunatus sp. Y2014]|uniref:M81 family metallopeptidase n=1 Tax=Microlunatus sp. Y2014 TaxID=3418488 RepID=UPI003DA73E3E